MDATARAYTVEDIWALPDGERAELIDGMWYDMAAPSAPHQWIVSRLTARLNDHIDQKGGSCMVFPAPLAVYLNDNNRTYVEPDITVLCDRNKYRTNGIYGAPDLVIEVTSPTTRKRDYGIKLFKYRNAGVREYWIINPDDGLVHTYFFDGEEEEGEVYRFDDEVSFGLYPDLTIRMDEIMQGLPETDFALEWK